MIKLTIPIELLVIHCVADFFFQTYWMGANKSKNWYALTAHVAIYSAFFLACGATFVAITFVTHFLTDAVTSRCSGHFFQRWYADITSRDWTRQHNAEDNYGKFEFFRKPPSQWFFFVIGVDQLIHAFTLALTWRYCFGPT